jgi:hypothetical protein
VLATASGENRASPAGFSAFSPETVVLLERRENETAACMSKSHKIDARLAIKVISDLRQHGVNTDSLLKEVGLRRADVSDEDNRIPYAAVLG